MNDIQEEISILIKSALAEDIRTGDITSEACIPPDAKIEGKFLLKEGGRLAALPFLELIFKHVDPRIDVTLEVEEGTDLAAGVVLGKVIGPARGVLSAERVALNIVQHASGVATMTRKFVDEVRDYDCDILDTRKTLPGLRALEKYAVKLGGGTNHRLSLDHRFIIKNNHLSFLEKETTRPIIEAVKRARAYRHDIQVEVEVDTLAMVEAAIDAEADIIMLDNMTVEAVAEAVKMINDRAYVEASGGIVLDTVRAYAATGVDGISIGKLTHSVEALDISLRF